MDTLYRSNFKMKFYHFSSRNIKGDWLRPEYFGNNSYTKHSQRDDGTPRIYFYTTPHTQEHHFNGCRYRYTVDIPIDILDNCTPGINISETKIKGYGGILSNKTSPWQGCLTFECVKIIKKTDLWRIKKNV